MKIAILSLMLVLFTSACSRKTESTFTTQTTVAQFSLAPSDVVTTSVEVVTGRVPSDPTQKTAIVDVELSSAKAAEFRQFTKDHVHQRVQIVVGTKVVQEPVIEAEILSRKIDLIYSSPSEARSVADLFTKGHTRVTTAAVTKRNHKFSFRRFMLQQQKDVTQSQVVAYCDADTNNARNVTFTVSQIWKGAHDALTLGVTNGAQFSCRWTQHDGPLPDAAILIVPPTATRESALKERVVTYICNGRVGNMTLQEFKKNVGL